ncbi:MAG: rRNA adenine N-6-methyltransferase family protein [Ilumatobacteraceae bacterium]
MSGRVRSTARDERRRSYGQNFLVDRPLIDRFVAGLDLGPDDHVIDLGAGRGALTWPLAGTGATVWAVESDPVWSDRLRAAIDAASTHRVRVIPTDLRRLRLPKEPYRVVANPPFGLTTELLRLLLDRPERGPTRADLILQLEVARKHAASPPSTLRTAAWAPWWEFELGPIIRRGSFRPQPAVDAAVLTIRKRQPAILPERLAPTFAERLRADWQ